MDLRSVFLVDIIAVLIVLVLVPEKEVVAIHKGEEATDMTAEAVAILVATRLMVGEEATGIVGDHLRADFTTDLLRQNHEGEGDMIQDVNGSY